MLQKRIVSSPLLEHEPFPFRHNTCDKPAHMARLGNNKRLRSSSHLAFALPFRPSRIKGKHSPDKAQTLPEQSADTLRPNHKHFATKPQTLCKRSADTSRVKCKHFRRQTANTPSFFAYIPRTSPFHMCTHFSIFVPLKAYNKHIATIHL